MSDAKSCNEDNKVSFNNYMYVSREKKKLYVNHFPFPV